VKALTYAADGVMELRDVPVPQPAADEYLIRIDCCGICGSDVEGFLGKTGRRIAPMVMGHECAGTVASAPAGGSVAVGTKVVVFPKYYCGTCAACLGGRVNLCKGPFLGVLDFDGAFTEYILAKEQYLLPYEGISADIASLTEPAAVALSGVGKVPPEEIRGASGILVVGAGAIGLLVILFLKHLGARRVIASDMSASRLALAKRMGADEIVNPGEENFLEKITELTGGDLCDCSFEAVGAAASARSSLEALRFSGRAVWIGNAAKNIEIDMQSVVTREIRIEGNYLYSYQDFAKCLALLSSGEADPSPLITGVLPLSDGAKAFSALANNRSGDEVKIILHC